MEKFMKYIMMIDENCDDQQQSKVIHSYTEILFLVVTGFCFGCETIPEVKDFGEWFMEEYRRYLPYKHGIPSTATIYRCLSLIKPDYMKKLLNYKDNAMLKQTLSDAGIQLHIAVDGKYVRANKSADRNGYNILSAYNTDTNVTEDQKPVGMKENEITGTPEL